MNSEKAKDQMLFALKGQFSRKIDEINHAINSASNVGDPDVMVEFTDCMPLIFYYIALGFTVKFKKTVNERYWYTISWVLYVH